MKILRDSDKRVVNTHMYPSEVVIVEDKLYKMDKYNTYYGCVLSGKVSIGGRSIFENEVFSVTSSFHCDELLVQGRVVLFIRYGFIGQNVFGVTIEGQGRVQYIDRCTDSLLIYPPRKGDPCLNALFFPPGVFQTPHTHPTVRLGCVLNGSGTAHLHTGTISLNTGDVFMLEPHEVHNFSTVGSEGMTIIAYHPDSDFGPTDEDHPMKNRTYIK